MNANSPKDIIQKWIEEVVIGLNLCPFAAGPYKKGVIHQELNKASNQQEMLESFLLEIDRLNQNPLISNTLLVYPNCHLPFLNFNDFIGQCEYLLEEINAAEIFQIVCFHPHFLFDQIDENSRSHFVNRSPYPLIHILRTDEVEMALNNPQEAEMISENNENTLNDLDDLTFKNLFFANLNWQSS